MAPKVEVEYRKGLPEDSSTYNIKTSKNTIVRTLEEMTASNHKDNNRVIYLMLAIFILGFIIEMQANSNKVLKDIYTTIQSFQDNKIVVCERRYIQKLPRLLKTKKC